MFSHQALKAFVDIYNQPSASLSGVISQKFTCSNKGSDFFSDIFQSQNNVKYFIAGKDDSNYLIA